MAAKWAYYNECDRQKAAWLRELVARGHIAQGEVDERSIKDVTAADLQGFRQCNFFAGVGAWSYALRQAGWPDEREVWTGSCPCQSFSVAGRRRGFDDERHLWPDWFRLIAQCRPGVVFGEQSASKDALAWIDLVQSDVEGQGYALGALDLCAAGFGAPHIRQRLYFVADTGSKYGEVLLLERGPQHTGDNPGRRSGLHELGDTGRAGLSVCERAALQRAGRGAEGRATEQSGGSLSGLDAEHWPQSERPWSTRRQVGERPSEWSGPDCPGGVGGLADADDAERWPKVAGRDDIDGSSAGRDEGDRQPGEHREASGTGPTNGLWRDADWLHCTDGKWRPVEPGTSPLAHGAAGRVGRLRGYGDAIVTEVATAFIEAYMRTR